MTDPCPSPPTPEADAHRYLWVEVELAQQGHDRYACKPSTLPGHPPLCAGVYAFGAVPTPVWGTCPATMVEWWSRPCDECNRHAVYIERNTGMWACPECVVGWSGDWRPFAETPSPDRAG